MYSVKLLCFFLASVGYMRVFVNAVTGNAPPLPPNSITCGSNYVKIMINNSYINATGIDNVDQAFLVTNSSYPHAIDPACVLQKSGDYYSIFLNKSSGECAVKQMISGSTFNIHYELHVVPKIPNNTVILRVKKLSLHLHCEYNTIVVDRINFVPVPIIDRIYVEQSHGRFRAEMARYSNDSFTRRLIVSSGTQSDPSVLAKVGDAIFIGARLMLNSNRHLILQAHSCWATPSPNPSDSVRMNIIENGCAVNDPVSRGENRVIKNYENEHVYFSFRSFYWLANSIATSRIYPHCNFTVCDNRTRNDCTNHSCSTAHGRRRRSLGVAQDHIETVSLGPIEVEPPTIKTTEHQVINNPEINENEQEQSNDAPAIARFRSQPRICDKTALGCSYDCAVGEMGRQFCVCPSGFGIAFNRKGCKLPTKIVPEGLYRSNLALPTFAMLLTSLVITSYFIQIARQNK